MEKLNAFGKHVRKLRKVRGLKQYHMAEMLGISKAYLSSMELGGRPIPMPYIHKIAEWLDLGEEGERDLTNAVLESNPRVRIDVRELREDAQNFVYALVHDIFDLDEEKINALSDCLASLTTKGVE